MAVNRARFAITIVWKRQASLRDEIRAAFAPCFVMQIAGLGAANGRQEGALAGAGPVKRPIVAYDRHFDRRLCSETETVFFSHDSRVWWCVPYQWSQGVGPTAAQSRRNDSTDMKINTSIQDTKSGVQIQCLNNKLCRRPPRYTVFYCCLQCIAA